MQNPKPFCAYGRLRIATLCVLLGAIASCSDGGDSDSRTEPTTKDGFGRPGPLSGDKGRSGFRFGVATAATQIEDVNEHTDWWMWTKPEPEGLGRSPFVGDAAQAFTRWEADLDLLAELGVDAYRFSIEWARIEPERDAIDEDALDHYSKFIDGLLKRKIRPMITVHHYSNPVWVADPRAASCDAGPSDTNLCGWDHPQGGPALVEEFAEHACLLARRFGDRVDEWGTLNEPFTYLAAAYGFGQYPPGKNGFISDVDGVFMSALRNFAAAHAAAYRAIHDCDRKDADGDGRAADIGLSMATAELVPARDHALSDDPEDIAARDRMNYALHFVFVDAFVRGGLDTDLDGEIDEPHEEWKDTLDWLGIQYYSRLGVTSSPGLLPKVWATPCLSGFDFGACVPPLDPTYRVPAMNYEHWPEGLYHRLAAYSQRYSTLPLVVTESGLATQVGARRSEVIVRALEQIQRARSEGIDVRGYYHWSIYDNFEWVSGYTPRFGLYTIDFSNQTRTPTEAVTTYQQIMKSRALTDSLRNEKGGTGPLTPEPED